jgi:hypothetical protein
VQRTHEKIHKAKPSEWMAHYINKDTKIKLFNVYVKSVRVPNMAGYMRNSEKASVLCKQMLAIYHEDLVAQGYI